VNVVEECVMPGSSKKFQVTADEKGKVRCTGEHQGLEANAADVSADMKKF
jgi:hypothetical protein